MVLQSEARPVGEFKGRVGALVHVAVQRAGAELAVAARSCRSDAGEHGVVAGIDVLKEGGGAGEIFDELGGFDAVDCVDSGCTPGGVLDVV